MNWIDIASIVFACVTANHLGLIKAIEDSIHWELPIINCCKCSTFWSVLLYTNITSCEPFTSLAISFFASYTAIWLELIEGYVDFYYIRLYEKIYTDTDDNKVATDTDGSSTSGSMPELR